MRKQNRLYAKGRTAPGQIVTNAKAGQSNHNYGIAVDYVLWSSDGKRAIWTVNSKWKRVAQIAKALEFAWGGD
ncbi:M15 family metallopeptidase [Bacillus sp. CLL-7-23]|uniref:M15 family metallopeptidase n=1 Tax=Bacillus changyiensis TaxID=3004103 RepID=A0ABT4X6F2_9BACI|nr:M15 family metallopeptidase [Bacillus changyiensis]MDA7027870.1 M15 family metallopeptidase [Bacillus changyiensis]